MKVFKIEPRFCTEDKVQITLNHVLTQLICSKDGYLFYKFKDLTLHRYITDPQRMQMPYHHIPFSDLHANHLFKFNQPYVFFTPYDTPRCPYNFIEDTFHTRFLYFIKLPDGSAAYADFSDFELTEKSSEIMTLDEINHFFYDISDPNVRGKYIVDWNDGIKYAKSKNETLMVDNFIDFSPEKILSKYKSYKEDAKTISSIEDLPQHKLTVPTLGYNPLFVVIYEDMISVCIFNITFLGKDRFQVNMNSGKVEIDENKILERVKNLNYTNLFNAYSHR